MLPTSVASRRLRIRRFRLGDAPALLGLRERNRAFLEPWEPRREPSWCTREGQRKAIAQALEAWSSDRGYQFGIEADHELVGGVAINNVVRGPFQNGYLGWYLDEAVTRRGYATEAVQLAIHFAFTHAGLHRVQAAIIPDNAPSLALARRVGLREEGLATRYLQIDGAWRDHLLFAVTAEEWRMP